MSRTSQSLAQWLLLLVCLSAVAACSTATPKLQEYIDLPACRQVLLGVTRAAEQGSYDNTERARRVTLKPFSISRHLVTVAQFAEFLNASPLARTHYEVWVVSRSFSYCALHLRQGRWVYSSDDAERPVNQATWFGASAYCHWLSEHDPSHEYTLPSEWQWEYAARGREGRAWPWGEEAPSPDRGWTWTRTQWVDPHGPREPAVGSYPGGDTPEGVADMMGYGMLEWCADRFVAEPGEVVERTEPDSMVDEPNILRVARGGAFAAASKHFIPASGLVRSQRSRSRVVALGVSSSPRRGARTVRVSNCQGSRPRDPDQGSASGVRRGSSSLRILSASA